MDTTTNLFEHIRNRLPSEYGLGDNNTQYDADGVPDHRVWEQSLREDHEGDVGVFQNRLTQIEMFHGVSGYEALVQIAVVCQSGCIEEAEKYLRDAYKELKNNDKSTGIYVKRCDFINIIPLGKNSIGNQMVEMDLSLKYVPLNI